MIAIAVAVLSGFGAALAAPSLSRRLQGRTGWILALLPVGLALFFASLLPQAAEEVPAGFSYTWAPELGLYVSFRADGLSLLFALLISGVGALVVIYAGGYLKGHAHLGRFYAWLLVFMASMLGVTLADNLILLFIFWELTSLSSYMLIGFDHERHAAREAALQSLLVTGTGGLALLVGLLLLGQAGSTMEISALPAQGEVVRASPFYTPALLLILIGAFTKSAQFPFHFWLPNAMEAPTPVSAYLHSATMVKAGVYLLARLSPVLGGTEIWLYAVGGTGAATTLVGGYLALAQTDLKRLLAYSTISILGTLTLLIGLRTPLAFKAMVVLLLAHALYKGALFLVAGALDHETGSRDVTRLGGLFRAMPITAVATGLAALSMAGLPPLFGFIAKELTYESALAFGPWLTAAVVIAGVFTVFVAGIVGVGPFWSSPSPLVPSPVHGERLRAKVHEAPFSLWLGPVVLAGTSLLCGLFPDMVAGMLIDPAVSIAIGNAADVTLALWHGVNPAFILSVITLASGVGMYALRGGVRREVTRLTWTWGPARLYAVTLDGLLALARGQARIVQSGYLRYYLMTIVLTTVGVVGFTMINRSGLYWPSEMVDVRFHEVALALLILLSAFYAAISPSRLGAVAALGSVGYGVALVYLLFGAPDLAMTQFLIESLTVILFVLVFYHLPRFAQLSPTRSRLRDASIALLAGGLMTVLVLSTVGVQPLPSISGYFSDNALPVAHGRNIVNVILVDFRGLDTLGEITVLGIAGIGVYALLKLRQR